VTVDCYNDSECVTGFFTKLDEHLVVPFPALALGVDVTDDERIAVVCVRGKSKQRIELLDLPLPSPEGAEWIDAYRHWTRRT
jgi:hypothetical protein